MGRASWDKLASLRSAISRHGGIIRKHRDAQTRLIKEYKVASEHDARTRIRDFFDAVRNNQLATPCDARPFFAEMMRPRPVKYLHTLEKCRSRLEVQLWRKFTGSGISVAYGQISATQCAVVRFFNHAMLRKKKTHYRNGVRDHGVLWCVLRDDGLGPIWHCTHMITTAEQQRLRHRHLGVLRRVSKGFLKGIAGYRQNHVLIASFIVDPCSPREFCDV